MANSFEDPGQDKPYASLLGGLFDTAVGIGKSYLPQPKRAAAPAPVPQTNIPPAQPAWLKPVLIGGGVLIALVVLLPLLGGRGK